MDKYLKVHLPKSNKEIKQIWDQAIFIVDTNILLNLYKYSNSTRNKFFNIMESLSSKTWIPHQVALEYVLNRTKKIHEQEKNYDNQVEAIENAKKTAIDQLNNKVNVIKKSFRKIDLEDIKKRITNFFDELKQEVTNNDDYTAGEFYQNDKILKSFLKLYENKIGEAYGQDELDELYKEGKGRYDKKIPPGYEDKRDKEGEYKVYNNTEIKSEYGDLLLWKQIIQKAKKEKKPVVFVTDDKKEDWWKIEHGKVKGPREELINEFLKETGCEILMYSTEYFLEKAKENLTIDINDDVIKEVKDAAVELDMLSKRNQSLRANFHRIDDFISRKDNDIVSDDKVFESTLKRQRKQYKEVLNKMDILTVKIVKLENLKNELSYHQQEEIEQMISSFKNEYQELEFAKSMLEADMYRQKEYK